MVGEARPVVRGLVNDVSSADDIIGYNSRMSTVVREVRELSTADRTALERVVGQPLQDQQTVEILVYSSHRDPETVREVATTTLPDWCLIYQGLSDSEIDDLNAEVCRSPDSREST